MNKTDKTNIFDSFIYCYQTPFAILLNAFYRITEKMSEGFRDSAINIICYFFPVFYIAFYSGVFGLPTFVTVPYYTLLGTFLFILLIIFSINKKIERVSWRHSLILPMIMAGAGIVIVGFRHTVGAGFQSFGFQLLFAFPPFFLIWNNREDYEVLYKRISKGTTSVVFAYFIICYILAYFGAFTARGVRWSGTMTNVNLLSQIGTNSALMCMYMIVADNKKKEIYYGVMGIGFGFALLGGSRGATGTCVLCAIVTLIYVLIREKKYKLLHIDKTKFAKVVAYILIFAMFLTVTYVGLPALQKTMFYSRTHAEYIEDEDSAIERMGIDSYKDANDFTSGRVDIWKAYIKRLNLLGHDYDSTDWKKITHTKNAHNIFLEVAYRCGAPIAALFVFTQLIAGLIALFILFNKKCTNTCYLFFILFFLEYFYESTVDVAIMPFHRYTALLFYISLVSVINRRLPQSNSK